MKPIYTSNRSLLSLLFILLSFFSARAQNVSRVEYFMDSDPGFGNGTSISISQSTDVTASFQVSVNELSKGFHTLVVRSFVAPYTVTENSKTVTKGGWSLSSRRSFYKEAVDVANVANIVKGEYFADTDPGFGNGINIPLSAGQHLSNLSFAYDISALSAGFHNIYVRFKDANGSWSLTSVRTFYKESFQQNSGTLPNIVKGEYYFDTDPGFGGGTNISITPGINLQNVTFTTDVTNLEKGFHQLYVRFKDANGRWSHTNTRTFYKEAFSSVQSAPDIVQLEYYIDNDPGFDNGKKVSVTPGKNIEQTFAVDMSNVSVGNHVIYVRAQDSKGNWSLVSTGSFKVETSSALFVTVGSINGPLCAGSPVNVPFTVSAPFGTNNIFTAQLSNVTGSFTNPTNIGTLTSNNNGTISAVIPANTAAGTGYRIRIVSSSPSDTSGANTTSLTINRVPEQTFSITGKANTCTGSEGYSISATSPNTKYAWELTGGGTIDTTATTATINWTTAGTYTLKATPSNTCGTGQPRTLSINVFSGVPTTTPTITISGRTLLASAATTANGASGYQWYKEGVIINNATNSSYVAAIDGTYTVRYTNPCGIGPESAPAIVTTKKPQTITFDPIPDITYHDTSFVVKAVASSGLPVTYSIVSGPATIKSDTITIKGAGVIKVRATQQGNDTLSSAIADASFTVNKASQTITFAAITDKVLGVSPFALEATSSAGLPITYSVVSGPASVSGNTVFINGVGTITVRARQLGNNNYSAATDIDRSFCVNLEKLSAITGLAQTCPSQQTYRVNEVNGAT